jgi:hypothetical protein
VANRNIDVGNKSSTRKPGLPAAEPSAESHDAGELRIETLDSPSADRPAICGAMSEQRGDGGRGNQSAPQKLLQLVGWRDSKTRPDPWVRPRVTPVKR